MRCTKCGHIQGVEVLETCDNCNSSAWFIDFPNPNSFLRFFTDERVIRCRSCGDYVDSVLCRKCEAWISGYEGFVGVGDSIEPIDFVPPCTECGETIGGPWLTQPCLHCGKTSSSPNEEEADLRRRIWGKDGMPNLSKTEDKKSKFDVLTILAYGFIALNVLGGLLMLLGFLFYR